jgi:hypothetical protein
MMVLPTLHQIIAGLVRRTWLVVLATVLVCAMFASRAVTAFGAVEPPPVPAVHPRSAPTPAPRAPIDASVLVERNIFCSSCWPAYDLTPGQSYAGQPAILIATSLGLDTRATVRVIPTDVQGSWALDDTIPGVGRVARIGASSIDVIDDAGHTQRLALLEPIESPRAAGHPGAGAATPGAGPAATDPFAGRIKKLAEGSYEVDRSVVRELVATAGSGAGVRAMPVLDKGEVKGLRFSSVRSTSVAAAVGLKGGDVLSAIDGDPIKTANQLLDLYGKLDKLDGIELQGTRAGKPLSVSLRFR